jgi:pimeloyl-ACP methyl ester carboxylesterase
MAAGCQAEGMDGSDLRGLFDKSAVPLSKTRPAPKKKRKKKKKKRDENIPPPPPPTERERIAGPCLKVTGKPAKKSRRQRNEGMPACRRANVLEHRDAQMTPRYGCIFTDRKFEERKPLPLVVFLHGEGDDPTAVHRKTRLRLRYADLDLSGDPKRSGFVILAPQARRFNRRLVWDVDHHSRDNLDALAINHFIDELIEEGAIDPRQIYVIGHGRGGVMAALYAHLYPERVAAFGAFGADASHIRWTCDGAPPPAAVLYRACDAITPCEEVEEWLNLRDDARAPTFSLRLTGGKATAPSCNVNRAKCGKKSGTAKHNRWPKPREREMLEYLSRFSFKE